MEYEYDTEREHTNKRFNDERKLIFLKRNMDSIPGNTMVSFPTHKYILEDLIEEKIPKITTFLGLERSKEEYEKMLFDTNKKHIPIFTTDTDFFKYGLPVFNRLSPNKVGYIELDWMGPWCRQKKEALTILANSQSFDRHDSFLLSTNLMVGREHSYNMKELSEAATRFTGDVPLYGTKALTNKILSGGWRTRVAGSITIVRDIFSKANFQIEVVYADGYIAQPSYYHTMYKITKQ